MDTYYSLDRLKRVHNLADSIHRTLYVEQILPPIRNCNLHYRRFREYFSASFNVCILSLRIRAKQVYPEHQACAPSNQSR